MGRQEGEKEERGMKFRWLSKNSLLQKRIITRVCIHLVAG